MELRDDLLAQEKGLWQGGATAYRSTLDGDCLVAFTEMAGISSREEIAGQAEAMRWREVDIDLDGFLQPTDDVAILTYHVHAKRNESTPYEALVSSGYVRRNGGWKMMFHQQTPLGDQKPKRK
jgi:hypothetical protein